MLPQVFADNPNVLYASVHMSPCCGGPRRGPAHSQRGCLHRFNTGWEYPMCANTETKTPGDPYV